MSRPLPPPEPALPVLARWAAELRGQRLAPLGFVAPDLLAGEAELPGDGHLVDAGSAGVRR